ncbi:MAG: DUF4982 domain-containing protein, partial [Verrucomicrobia bacterium]|nr:DUF4982 domain-containing protein [Verrucomicrobiota bacterium]
MDKVALLLNGQPVPAAPVRTNTFQFTFPEVEWAPGKIEAIGYDAAGRELARWSHETAGEPAALRLSVIQGPTGWRADGS